MSPDYYLFVASIARADTNVQIIFAGVCILLVTYKAIDWYPVKWQKASRIAAQAFSIFLLAATVWISL